MATFFIGDYDFNPFIFQNFLSELLSHVPLDGLFKLFAESIFMLGIMCQRNRVWLRGVTNFI